MNELRPSRWLTLFELALKDWERWESAGDESLIHSVIKSLHDAVTEAPPDERGLILTNLAIAYLARFQVSGTLSDLDTSIGLSIEATKSRHVDDRGRVGAELNLATALQLRANYLGAPDDLDQAIELFRRGIAGLPEDHPDRLRMLANLGAALTKKFDRSADLADLDQAIELFRRGIAGLPEDHPDRLRMLANLGAALTKKFENLGDATNASTAADSDTLFSFEEDLRVALNQSTEILGRSNPTSLRMRLQLAHSLHDSDDQEEFLHELNSLVDDHIRQLGPSHLSTLSARFLRAQWRGRLGDTIGAASDYESLVDAYVEVLGVENPITLEVRHQYALWLGYSGASAKAAQELRGLFDDYLRILGPMDSKTVTTGRDLDFWSGVVSQELASQPATLKKVITSKSTSTSAVNRGVEGQPGRRMLGWQSEIVVDSEMSTPSGSEAESPRVVSERMPVVSRLMLAERGPATGSSRGDPNRRVRGEERISLTEMVVAAYEKGRSIRDIASSIGRSYGFVHRLLAEAGVDFRTRGAARKGARK
jgi:tetratricopeptide (TPR) repeat protein